MANEKYTFFDRYVHFLYSMYENKFSLHTYVVQGWTLKTIYENYVVAWTSFDMLNNIKLNLIGDDGDFYLIQAGKKDVKHSKYPVTGSFVITEPNCGSKSSIYCTCGGRPKMIQ